MNQMVTDVLNLNRVESGRVEYDPKDNDLITIAKSVWEEILPLAKENHNLVFNTDLNSCPGKFDEKLMKSVLNNLLSNAIKYSPSGGKVELKIEKDNSNIFINISDNGLGIPEEDQNKLFVPFFRANNIGNISGTGLGLSIVKTMIELQKGKINFISKKNEGTTFNLQLPILN